jgi:hypothetical protein
MTASEVEQHRAEQEMGDSDEGFLQHGVIGSLLGGEPCVRVPPEDQGDDDE